MAEKYEIALGQPSSQSRLRDSVSRLLMRLKSRSLSSPSELVSEWNFHPFDNSPSSQLPVLPHYSQHHNGQTAWLATIPNPMSVTTPETCRLHHRRDQCLGYTILCFWLGQTCSNKPKLWLTKNVQCKLYHTLKMMVQIFVVINTYQYQCRLHVYLYVYTDCSKTGLKPRPNRFHNYFSNQISVMVVQKQGWCAILSSSNKTKERVQTANTLMFNTGLVTDGRLKTIPTQLTREDLCNTVRQLICWCLADPKECTKCHRHANVQCMAR